MDSLFIDSNDAALFLSSVLFSWKTLLGTALTIWMVRRAEEQPKSTA